MQISVSEGEKLIYLQEVDANETQAATIAFIMQQPIGNKMTTKVTNRGHEMVFKSETVDVDGLLRKVNGIIIRNVSKKATTE